MLDKQDPNDFKKIVGRAVKLERLLTELRMICEVTGPGSGDMFVKSILMGGIIVMNDEDYDTYFNDINTVVKKSTKLLKEHAMKLLEKEGSEEKSESDEEMDFDSAKLHSNKKPN